MLITTCSDLWLKFTCMRMFVFFRFGDARKFEKILMLLGSFSGFTFDVPLLLPEHLPLSCRYGGHHDSVTGCVFYASFNLVDWLFTIFFLLGIGTGCVIVNALTFCLSFLNSFFAFLVASSTIIRDSTILEKV